MKEEASCFACLYFVACHGVFELPFGNTGRLRSVIVAVSGYINTVCDSFTSLIFHVYVWNCFSR